MIRRLLLTILLPGHLSANDWAPLADKLENISRAGLHQFGVKDDNGRSMDCLEVFQPKGKTSVYGIYHTLRDGVFSVHLATSKDLRVWKHLVELDDHASQAAIYETNNGSFLMAYEKDAPNSCWIGIRSYQNLEALTQGKVAREFQIPRSLAPTAEGTPSFDSVTTPNDDLDTSTIKLRFHFYENARVDQLAFGTLTNFKTWKATPSHTLNTTFKKLGGQGNLGDRDPFQWNGRQYYLQEIQGKAGDWGSWGIYLCNADGAPLKKLDFKTPKGSTAFSNPSVTSIRLETSQDKLIFCSYIHSRGTPPGETGQFLSLIEIP